VLDRLAVYTRAAAHILKAWDDYSDQHVDDHGWPLNDVAYGMRQRQRDADTWRAFDHVREHATEVLEMAEEQLAALPADRRAPGWRDQLSRLAQARNGLENAQAVWQAERDALPASAGPGTEAYDEPLAERNADAWGYLCDWADTGHVLTEIARAAATASSDRTAPSAEHTRAQDSTGLPPQPPGRPHRRGPR
jgi:hypothetical protein